MDRDEFGAMFEESLKNRRKVTAGEKVKATVLQAGKDRLVLDLGGGLDGILERTELGEEGSRPDPKVGDVVEAFVLRADDRVVELGLRVGRSAGGAVNRAVLEDAQRSGLPVEGTVTEVNKGGYVVEVSGQRCFCPLGQMDLRRIEDPATMVGQRLLFRVTEVRSGKDVVVSRKALLEAEQHKKGAETRKSLAVGARFKGSVVSLRDFGAFVDLGGVEGLIPASELGFGRSRPQDVLHAGQEVDVEVVRMEPGKDGKERITLSIKALLDDPFEAVADALKDGTVVVGRVTRLRPFGAFVELEPGVEGLIHVSAFGKRIGQPSDVVKPDQTVAVRVDGVDRAARRIALAYLDATILQAHGWTLGGDTAEPASDAAAAGPGAKKGAVIHRKQENKPAAAASVSSEGGGGLSALRILGHMEPAPVTQAALPAEASTNKPARPAQPVVRIGDVHAVTVDRIEPFGVFVTWATGRGLVPGMELGVPRNTDLRRSFPVGTTFKAAVVDVRNDGKVKLSKTEAEKAEERAETAEYMKSTAPVSGKGFGTFADLLKARTK